jgi:hypothetical protein
MDVDPVEQGAGDPLQAALDLERLAGAAMRADGRVAAGQRFIATTSVQ